MTYRTLGDSMKITFDGTEDHEFRSQLERDVATELDSQDVEWRYEVQVTLPDGTNPWYLPDFTIDEARDELRLPEWVECKPQQMLYNLRDSLGVTRRAGEYFKTDVIVEGASSDTLKARGVEELWKPKMLAEKTGGSVLVLGGVGGTNLLTVAMRPDDMVFSRTHPFVNWRKHVRDLKREEERAEWERRSETWRQQAATTQAAQRKKRLEAVRVAVRHYKRMNPRFASACSGCLAHGDDGGLYRVRYENDREGWMRVCPDCEWKAKS